jgi:hypothetical protein
LFSICDQCKLQKIPENSWYFVIEK